MASCLSVVVSAAVGRCLRGTWALRPPWCSTSKVHMGTLKKQRRETHTHAPSGSLPTAMLGFSRVTATTLLALFLLACSHQPLGALAKTHRRHRKAPSASPEVAPTLVPVTTASPSHRPTARPTSRPTRICPPPLLASGYHSFPTPATSTSPALVRYYQLHVPAAFANATQRNLVLMCCVQTYAVHSALLTPISATQFTAGQARAATTFTPTAQCSLWQTTTALPLRLPTVSATFR